MTERCDYCQRRLDRPGTPDCDNDKHAIPSLTQRIVAAIENDLNDRRGLKINTLDYDTQDEIRDRWTALIEDEVERAFR